MRNTSKLYIKRMIAFLLAFGLISNMLFAFAENGQENNVVSSTGGTNSERQKLMKVDSYFDYIQKYADESKSDESVALKLQEFVIEAGDKTAAVSYKNQYGSEAGLILAQKSGTVSWNLEVPQSGMYYIKFKYLALIETDYAISMGLLVDGVSPYAEARSCSLSRVYENESVESDKNGNDIRPTAKQQEIWQTRNLKDQSGVVGNICFYLKEGTHTLSLEVEENIPFLVEQITLTPQEYILSYQDYLSYNKQQNGKITENIVEKVQGENYYQQSSAALWPTSDNSSLLVEPFDYNVKKLNVGGGSQWTTPGDWISYEIDIPEDGFYQIAFKYRQGYLDGLFSSRTIYIDGEIPFQEMKNVRFNYSESWNMMTLGDGKQDYSVYLTKGRHIVTLENTLGDSGDTIATIDRVSQILNEQYLSVVMVTGAEPDIYRDYFLEKTLPDLVPQLTKATDLLKNEIEHLIAIVGERGAETSYFEDVIYDLESIANNIESLTYNSKLSTLKDIISGLAEKMIELEKQALDIDYFVLYSKGAELPRINMNFWESIKFQAILFLSSFTKDYVAVDNFSQASATEIDVWLLNSGAEQLTILSEVLRESFSTNYNVSANLKLVTGSVTQAIVSGIGPDVVIGIDADTIVNLALRGALESLTDYSDIQTLEKQYIPGSFTPFILEDHLYGIPLTNDFAMLFVREDVFASLDLSVPSTWDEVLDISQILERQNMSLGCVPAFASLIYQNGGQYFDDKNTKVLFDEEVSIDAMQTMAEYYTIYGFPITFDFISRFRTGEMPIGLANYSTYVKLKYSAPEINGLWNIYTTPGTVQKDGTVNSTWADAGGTGISILSGRTEKEKKAALEFVTWFCDGEIQARYGNDLEASLGISGRYATANMLALEKLNWTSEEKKVLFSQIKNLVYIPIVPGNYYVNRGLTNATRAVVYDGVSARETLTEWTKKINFEITRKRNEFSLNN